MTFAREIGLALTSLTRGRRCYVPTAGLRYVVALGLVAIGWAGAPSPASADTVTYMTSLQGGNMCHGCGPFGTVSVSSTANPDELSVSLTLNPGEVFASTGAGAALMFDVSGNPPLLAMSLLPSGYTFHDGSPLHADGSGNWNSYVSCDICGSGTSPPQSSGPITFLLEANTPLTPTSFVANNNGFLFASDIGVPNGSGGYFTGDVATNGPLSPVPLPAAAWLLMSGLAGIKFTTRRRTAAA